MRLQHVLHFLQSFNRVGCCAGSWLRLREVKANYHRYWKDLQRCCGWRLDIMEWWDGVMRVDPPPTLPLLLLWALGSSSDSGGYYLSPITSRQKNSLLITFGYYV